jgi:hypothetical protein
MAYWTLMLLATPFNCPFVPVLPFSNSGLKQGRMNEEPMCGIRPHRLVRNGWDGTFIGSFEFDHRITFIHMVF